MESDAESARVNDFLKRITDPADISDVDRAELSKILKKYTKEGLKEFFQELSIGGLNTKELGCLRRLTRKLVTSFINLDDCTQDQDQEGIKNEKKEIDKILKEIRQKLGKIPCESLVDCVILTLLLVLDFHGRVLGAAGPIIDKAQQALTNACLGIHIGGTFVFGTALATATMSVPGAIIVLGVTIGIGIILLAIHSKYKELEVKRAQNIQG